MIACIYFVKRADGPIKIGHTRSLITRIAALQSVTVERLQLLGSATGSRNHEIAIHKCLAEYRLFGDWFTDCDPVRALITKATSDGIDALGLQVKAPKPPEHPILMEVRRQCAALVAHYEAQTRSKMLAYKTIGDLVGVSPRSIRSLLSRHSEPSFVFGMNIVGLHAEVFGETPHVGEIETCLARARALLSGAA